jgi:predicted amidohydrolase
MAFLVASAQFAPEKAAVGTNLDRIAEFAIQAQSEGAELVVFPETATSAYFLEGGVLESALTSEELLTEVVSRLAGSLKKPLDLLIGFYEKESGNLYNSAAYLEIDPLGSRLVHVYRKFFLPTYGVFDEERFVARGRELGVFDTRLGRMGCLICEDVWHSVLSALCAVEGAQVILVPSASPARGFSGSQIGNLDRYTRMLRAVSEEHGVYCVNSQLCGFEGGKGFVGGSSFVDPTGRIYAQSPVQDEHLLIAPIDLDVVDIQRSQFPLISDLQSSWEDIRRFVNQVQ